MSATTDSGITPDLIDRLRKLSADDQDKLIDLMLFDRPGDAAPGATTDWSAEIARRAAEASSGTVPSLSREQAEAQVRDAVRKLGVEL